MKNEKTIQESVNAVILTNAEDKLSLEIGAVITFNEKTLTITGKNSKVPEKGGKTLWTGNIDGEEFVDKDSQQLRKMFGLLPRHREVSAGKTFIHEGHEYSLDATADAMISGAMARYNELTSLLDAFCEQYGIIKGVEPEQAITAKVEAVCLARQVVKAEAEAKAAKEKAEKAAATKEQREKNKEVKVKFKELLIAANFDFNTALDALCKQYEIEKAVAVAIVL